MDIPCQLDEVSYFVPVSYTPFNYYASTPTAFWYVTLYNSWVNE